MLEAKRRNKERENGNIGERGNKEKKKHMRGGKGEKGTNGKGWWRSFGFLVILSLRYVF